MPLRRTQSKPFGRRARSDQNHAYRRAAQMIRRASPVLGGSFYTHHYMHGENGWLDGYFLGTKKPNFYNFAFQTVAYAYKEAVVRRAWKSSYELTPIDLDPSIFKDSFKDPVSGLYVTPPAKPCITLS